MLNWRANIRLCDAQLIVFTIVLVLLTLVPGCQEQKHFVCRIGCEDAVLSSTHSTARFEHSEAIRLLSIGEDGTTTIQFAETKYIASAKPGEAFATVNGLKCNGLQLLGASWQMDFACIRCYWSKQIYW